MTVDQIYHAPKQKLLQILTMRKTGILELVVLPGTIFAQLLPLFYILKI